MNYELARTSREAGEELPSATIHHSSFIIHNFSKAFTLIELLTIVAIIGLMATVGIMGLNAGKGAAKMRGAARDIFATIRHARSVALVTQQPAIITYSEKMVDDDICASIEVNGARMIGGGGPKTAETISGEIISLYDSDDDSSSDDSSSSSSGGGGMSSEDFFFAPISEDVVRGIRIQVTMGDEKASSGTDTAESYKPAISVFSNVDYLLGRFKEAKKSQQEKDEAAAANDDAPPSSTTPSPAPVTAGELQSDVSIVWEVNGRCEPHNVWIYREGMQPDSGLCIKVDRFGGAKILNPNEE